MGQVEQCDIIPLIVEGAGLLQDIGIPGIFKGNVWWGRVGFGTGKILPRERSGRRGGKCAKLMLTRLF